MKRNALLLFIFLLIPINTAIAYDYTVEPFLSLSEQYNDNITLRNSDRISDFITYVSPGIDFSVKSLNTDLKVDYFPTFSFYGSHSELNDTGHHSTANGTFILSDRLTFALANTFVKSSDVEDIRALTNVGPITRLAQTTFDNAYGKGSYKLTKNLTYILGLAYSYTDQEGFTRTTTFSGNMGLAYMSSERTTYSANATFTKYYYNPGNDATGQDYTLGVTHKLTPTVTIAAAGGVVITKVEHSGAATVDFTGGIDIKKSFETGAVTLSYKNTVIPSIESNSPLRGQTVRLDLSKPLSKKITTSLSSSYSNYKSIGTTTNKTDRDDIGFTTALNYNIGPAATLTLSYSYTNSNDKINNLGDYHDNIVFIALRLSYSKRL